MSSSENSAPSSDRSQDRAEKMVKANSSNFAINNNGAANQIINASAPVGASILANSSYMASATPCYAAVGNQGQLFMLSQMIRNNSINQQYLLALQAPLLGAQIIPPSGQQTQQPCVQTNQLPQQNNQIMQQQVVQYENLNQEFQQTNVEDANKADPGPSSTVDSTDMRVAFENFPYYLSDKTKHLLVGSYFLHLNSKILPVDLKQQRRVLFSSPEGFDIYHEALAMALADSFGCKVLVLDCLENSSDLSKFGQQTSTDALRFHLRPTLAKYIPRKTCNIPGSSAETSKSSVDQPTLFSSNMTSQGHVWTKGDRVIFTGLKYIPTYSCARVTWGPTFGYRGTVVMSPKKNQVAVRFDLPVFRGGNDLGGNCESLHGFYCNGNDLCIDGEDEAKPAFTNSYASRIIVLVTQTENCLAKNPQAFQGLKTMLDRLPNNVHIIGSNIQNENTTPKVNPKENERSSPNIAKMMELFPERIDIDLPEEKNLLDEFKQQLHMDDKSIKVRQSMAKLAKLLTQHRLTCNDIEAFQLANQVLTDKDAESVIKLALGYELMSHHQTCRNFNSELSIESIRYGINHLPGTQSSEKKSKLCLKNIAPANEFERKVLEDVVPHGEIEVKLDDIGAFDNVKDALKELVMLPLERPELFCKGQLRKPCRGILLFGPPGTGKTMLAKAVATESGANFINVSQSAIHSKLYGEAEKYVKAIFKVASKIAPCVVFIDEVDSLLGKRHGHEHDVSRRIKNEFMLHWDGFLTRDTERVIVLAATNRPFELDEAVIRRMPRRIMVNLPDAACRVKILKVILGDEELCPDIDFDAIARMTEGFSGSDLKDLCVAAAHCPVRELLKNEKVAYKYLDKNAPNASIASGIRPLNMEDFKHACNQVRASVASNSSIMTELQQWNERCGERGSSQKNTSLSYYI